MITHTHTHTHTHKAHAHLAALIEDKIVVHDIGTTKTVVEVDASPRPVEENVVRDVRLRCLGLKPH